MHEPPKRRKLTKAERQEVYAKCDGHCAYCGREITMQQMQVDHVVPLDGWTTKGPDTLDNMLPACRSCNHYKSRSPLESFRAMLEAQPNVLARDSVTYQIAVRYATVTPTPHSIVFYFERIAAK